VIFNFWEKYMNTINFAWSINSFAYNATAKNLLVNWSCTARKEDKFSCYSHETMLPYDEAKEGAVKVADLARQAVLEMLLDTLGSDVQLIEADRSNRVEEQLQSVFIQFPLHQAIV
jgi:hypothetical protein